MKKAFVCEGTRLEPGVKFDNDFAGDHGARWRIFDGFLAPTCQTRKADNQSRKHG